VFQAGLAVPVQRSRSSVERDARPRGCSTASVKVSLALLLLSLTLFSTGCVTEPAPSEPKTYGHVKSLKEAKKKEPPKKEEDTTSTMVTQ
jgi:hypothetical protein